MKTRHVWIGLMLAVLMVFAPAVGAQNSPIELPTGSVVGQVEIGASQDPTGVRLTLGGKTINPSGEGDFVFPDVPYGTYDLVISVPGLSMSFIQDVVVSAPENSVDVALAGEIELTNPGFEMSPAGPGKDVPGWKGGGAAWSWASGKPFSESDYASVSDERAYEGTQSIKLEGFKLPGSTKNVISEPRPAVPGFVYTASARVYSDTTKGSPSPYPMLYMAFYDDGGKRIHLVPLVRVTSASHDAWELITTTATAPDGAASLMVFVSSNTSYAGTSYWDDFKLEYSIP